MAYSLQIKDIVTYILLVQAEYCFDCSWRFLDKEASLSLHEAFTHTTFSDKAA